jgi:hypothetical protein
VIESVRLKDWVRSALEVEKNKAEDPPGREERQDLARARGTLWPFPRWKEAIDRAYGGEAPALSFTRLRRDEYGRRPAEHHLGRAGAESPENPEWS